MQRTSDPSVSIVGPTGEAPVVLDSDGVVSLSLSGATYERVSAE